MSHCHSKASGGEGVRGRGRGEANFGCTACEVRITIFSAALPPPTPPHCLFNYHSLQRERGGGGGEQEKRGVRTMDEVEVLDNAGDERVEMLERKE